MAGDEEAKARAVLAEMQLRISQGPTSALGIGEVVTPDDVRAAFLGLTKQFHPARFGRLAPELQKLANEVFLGIKAAHDHMLKVLGSSPASARGGSARGGSSTRSSTGAIPIMTPAGADGTSRTAVVPPRGTQSIPRVDPGTQPPTAFARGTDRDGRTPPRAITPVMGVPVGGAQRAGTPPPHGTTQPITRPMTPVPPGTQPGVSAPGTRPITPVPPGTQPGVAAPGSSQRMVRVRTSTGAMINMPAGKTSPPTSRTMTPVAPGTNPLKPVTLKPGEATSPLAPQKPITLPPGQTSPLAPKPITLRPGEATSPLKPITLPPGQTSPLAPPTQPPRPYGHGTGSGDGFNPPTVRNVAPTPHTASQAITQPLSREKFDDAAAFREAAAIMEQKNWPAAVQALATLTERVPYNKSYRAWFHYANGRAAYIAGRPDDAISEMQRALQAEPNHAHARHALSELQKRR